MILATHELVGAAIGEKIHNPWLIIVLSLAMHFALDTFRHGEYLGQKPTIKNTLWKVSLDLTVGLAIIIFYISIKHPGPSIIGNIFLGAFFSIFPDGLTFLYWKANAKFFKKIIYFHSWIHRYSLPSPECEWTLRNSLNDIIFSLIAIVILFVK